MSYDLQIWSVHSLNSPCFAHPEQWQQEAAGWTYSKTNWQIVVGASNKVLPEDVPDEVAKLIPGIRHLIEINLEGRRPHEALRLAQSTANSVARATHGVIVDPQEDTVRMASGVKRFVPPKREENFEVLALSWWFMDGPLLTPAGRKDFFGLLERMLPEALPKRYGLYEPPQHLYAETGKAHLLNFLEENLHELKVFYPRRPVVRLGMSFPAPPGPHKLGFRTNHISIEVEREALNQPGWQDGLQLFWQTASRLVRPFYGDVRALSGRARHGALLFITPRKGDVTTNTTPTFHPVTSWWWRGIPGTLGLAAVLGSSYRNLWPAFESTAVVVDELAFLSKPDWRSNTECSELLGGVPEPLAQPAIGDGREQFAKKWPFSA
jgi:hypothetical protein